ncbi:MAG: N-acetylneuraminate synthase [Candidatus Omnitrophica bacterium]|nr:N-acetylneuraminate synthase [Candidatus Omnitrophota bacterium]
MPSRFLLSKKTFIIAEAGVNHNGQLSLAKKMIDAAKEAGCDAVKFQAFKTEALVLKDTKLADYQKAAAQKNVQSQYDLLKQLELSEKQFLQLHAHCKKKNILFLATPFDDQSLMLLDRINVPVYKVSSGDLTNLPYLKKLAKRRKWIVLSTGMGTILEIKEAVETIQSITRNKLCLLHCTTDYPTRLNDVHLRMLNTLQKMFHVPVGYSDHSQSTVIPAAAVAMGARVIEKHFTLDQSLPGPDHQASLEPEALNTMVANIRNVETAMGLSVKRLNANEKKNLKIVRKSLFSARNLSKGHILKVSDVVICRPAKGLAPKHLERIIGKPLKRDISKDHPFTWGHIK